MLSGIGPRSDLEDLGIKVIRNLPVGQTLYELIGVLGPIYVLDNLDDGLVSNQYVLPPDNVAKWAHGKGPLTMTGAESLVFFRTNHSIDTDPGYPDIELMQAMESNAFDFAPTARKLFYPNFYHAYNDIQIQIDSMRRAQKIVEQNAFKGMSPRKHRAHVLGCEENIFDTDEYWECYIRHFSTPVHHQVGTSKMGPATDPTSVVNNELFVHSFENLRVIDVSIIPEGPSGHKEAYSYLIGERGADLIKAKWTI